MLKLRNYVKKPGFCVVNDAVDGKLEIVSGEPAEEILRLANIYKVDLIAIGDRGLTGLKRILEGSVSSEVVAEAPCSVLVVRAR